MSKTIDDPVLISVPTEFKNEAAIRAAIASSSNDYCSKSFFFVFRTSHHDCRNEIVPYSQSWRMHVGTANGILQSFCIIIST